MRELKFRAWSEETRTLYSSNDIREFPLEHIKNGDVWTFEQYTGLKDKNGKEIYEGDIVEEDIDFNSDMTDGTFRYSVYWDDSLLCWTLDPIGRESIHDELWQTNLSRRVIGNIHETKLLKEDKDE